MLRILNQPIEVEWGKFSVGTSIFIPCLNRDEVEQDILQECERHGFVVTTKKIITRGMYGVRVWRTR